MAENKNNVLRLSAAELFNFWSGALIIFWVMELIWPNIILAYFNLNWLFLAWTVTAVFLLRK